MDVQTTLALLFRWLHIIPAALAVGGIFFFGLILPPALSLLDQPQRDQVMLRCRRAFKMLIHTCILLLLASGIYNVVRLWPQYSLRPGLLHGLIGLHMLLALGAFAIALWVLAGDQPARSAPKWVLVNVVLLLVVLAVASTVKQVREAAPDRPAPAEPASAAAAPAEGR